MYRIYAAPHDRMLALLGLADHSTPYWALQDVSFELQRGQCLGVIGDNGAGKSTLLKLLAGTLHPTHGQIDRVGRVTAILELGAGFHPDFTGRDNLIFGGSFIGFDSQEMASLLGDIIEFSELGDAIDRPVKTYSSGMVVRLAFALVTAVMPELLIIDEALAVGDQHFQKKCVQRINDFRVQGCTILFCSHSLYHVRQLCDHALWLDQGRVRAAGELDAVLASYETHVRSQNQTNSKPLSDDPSARVDAGTGHQAAITQRPGLVVAHTSRSLPPMAADTKVAALVSVQVEDLDAGSPPRLLSSDLKVTITAHVSGDEWPSIGLMIEQEGGVGITSAGTHATTGLGNGLWRASVTFPALSLHTGEYVISVYLFDASGMVVCEEWPNCVRFLHVLEGSTPGIVRLPHFWS